MAIGILLAQPCSFRDLPDDGNSVFVTLFMNKSGVHRTSAALPQNLSETAGLYHVHVDKGDKDYLTIEVFRSYSDDYFGFLATGKLHFLGDDYHKEYTHVWVPLTDDTGRSCGEIEVVIKFRVTRDGLSAERRLYFLELS